MFKIKVPLQEANDIREALEDKLVSILAVPENDKPKHLLDQQRRISEMLRRDF